MEVYLIRHTKTIVDKNICYGQSNVALQHPFLADFENIVKSLNVNNAMVYSSPLERCEQLAKHFKIHHPSIEKIDYDDRLKELNFGDWELTEWHKINQKELTAWMADFVNYRVTNGESFIELYNRVTHFIDDELFKKNHRTPVIIITHAGVIRSFLCKVLGHSLKNAFKIVVDFGSITKINLSENNSSSNIVFTNKSANQFNII